MRTGLGTILYSSTGNLFSCSQPLYIAWWDYFDEKKPGKTKTITIDIGNIESVKVTETIPHAEWRKDLKEKEFPNFFKTEVKKVNNGKVSFDLGKSLFLWKLKARPDEANRKKNPAAKPRPIHN